MKPFKRITSSIRTQLLCWLVIPILVLLLVGVILNYGLAISLATDAYDKALIDSVYCISRCIENRDGRIVVDMPPAALEILRDDVSDKVYYQVLDKKLNLIAGDKEMPALAPGADLVGSSECFDGTIAGEQVRIALVDVPLPNDPKIKVFIQVGETMHQREHIAGRILTGVIVPQFIILGLSALLVWIGVKRGLRPLNNVKDAVAARSPVDLRPLATDNVPKEVRPLVAAINELLQRLQKDMHAQRRFVANAAHQLRTPIAGLKTQSEVALRQTDAGEIKHALGLIHTGAERATRLANQLLALARAEPGAIDAQLWRAIDLNGIAKSACREFVPSALSKNIDIGFEAAEAPVLIRADEASLHELICNLIHNAVQYTQASGQINVRVQGLLVDGAHFAELVVEDNGPGIPAEEREKVFERFYRLIDRGVSGSGLGLAIVREIANLHDAQVSLCDGLDRTGARVSVRFKTVAAQSDGGSKPKLQAKFEKEAQPVGAHRS